MGRGDQVRRGVGRYGGCIHGMCTALTHYTYYTYQAFLGMYVVAIGAEIPDTIQSVAVARRGYGAMDGSNY